MFVCPKEITIIKNLGLSTVRELHVLRSTRMPVVCVDDVESLVVSKTRKKNRG